MANCEKTGLHTWCNNKDVKRVQLRSQTAGQAGTNKFEGPQVNMCQECRKSNNGCFKIIKAAVAA